MAPLSEAPLSHFIDVAWKASNEIGYMGDQVLFDYETGKSFVAPDADTAKLWAFSRSIILELARRIEQLERA